MWPSASPGSAAIPEAPRSASWPPNSSKDAVVRNLQVLAESTTRLSDQIKATEPAIPWPEIRSFRNRLTHGYLAMDLDTVWEVVRQNLPELDDAVRRMRTRQ